ncbi:hypothetical protein GN244_ATG11243 [Phytophthora infestans]|uniref:Uncharacterized protein n=1 Tax=Phytophthora infestans TaxID=4787 RepID=A0A833RZV7_PHYIN|nr:hypothetical protein GN244_ATG11243 [Phytophthora infestans]
MVLSLLSVCTPKASERSTTDCTQTAFVTADFILHAWHRSFDAFLVDQEFLARKMKLIIRKNLSSCRAIAVDSGVNNSVVDVNDHPEVAEWAASAENHKTRNGYSSKANGIY